MAMRASLFDAVAATTAAAVLFMHGPVLRGNSAWSFCFIPLLEAECMYLIRTLPNEQKLNAAFSLCHTCSAITIWETGEYSERLWTWEMVFLQGSIILLFLVASELIHEQKCVMKVVINNLFDRFDFFFLQLLNSF